MKWGEFKKKVEEAGVRDESELWYIDTDFIHDLVVYYAEKLGWAVY